MLLRLFALIGPLFVFGCVAAPPAQLHGPVDIEDADPLPESRDGLIEEEEPSTVEAVLVYLPNRILDLLDIGRARLRFGLGIAGGVRATKPLTLYGGRYDSKWIGLSGPRGDRGGIPWPAGQEGRSGFQLTLYDSSTGASYYGVGEFGVDAQLIIVGAAVGLDVWEAIDFLVGIAGFDPVGDDY